ncbi:MAG: glycine--tRNA ligase subunit beta [Synechococcus sp. SB0666_bin_14]|nr:glycine--tRNA ligase subunit beta [Synechococcus sp. SB0666_bin_14]MYA91189.1 glycine--tRNA ligase subunit beta [Synechococcus sp. SB0663_bin_10]MYG47115.1 glycine--tRNA ligase subunit beta [Synechococcus sp. SB0675_bin_6]MYJ59008.1 glycine--tRNA ligase subunit beta [Synechococcus sp. SB0672_bin_6]MYK91204.1 glycine--tRNA ligase subunit beta [Synechococcus sp. SB0669_bin_8]
MASLVLEIGTEELPAAFCPAALAQLGRMITASLQDWHFDAPPLQGFATPRRLGVLVPELPPRQKELVKEHKGPPARQAFHGGQPTAAAQGFARRWGLAVEDLTIRATPKGEFVFAEVTQPGQATGALLREAIPGWIAAIQGKRLMRWGSGTQRFSRPIRWLVALLDDELLPVQLEQTSPVVTAQANSYGPRRGWRCDPIPIATAEAYGATLQKAGIVPDRQQRQRHIRRLIESKAAELGAVPQLKPALLEELTDLVEAPGLIVGRMEDRFLSLPAEVSAMEMVTHQRYVPLFQAPADPLALDAHGVLDPHFLAITNASPLADEALIIQGNERVLRARLADGAFFYDQDRSQSLESYLPRLEGVTFAMGLGSLKDRTDRLVRQAQATAMALQQQDRGLQVNEQALSRAALLCKADLVTQMVGEFPELQGVMGAKYAMASGEGPQVAEAIREHYLPSGADDPLPTSDLGRILALSERLELLVSIFATGQRPSGSSDPFALRRAGNGLLHILVDCGWSLDLVALLEAACSQVAQDFPNLTVNPVPLLEDLLTFLQQRLRTLLEDLGLDYDIIDAVAAEAQDPGALLQDPVDVVCRGRLLQRLRGSGELAPIQAVVQRAARLAEKGDLQRHQCDPGDCVDASLFSSPAEEAVLASLETLAPLSRARDQDGYERLLAGLGMLSPQLQAFFDGDNSVMVMAPDPEVRRNRLNLLAVLRNQALVIADFSRLSG